MKPAVFALLALIPVLALADYSSHPRARVLIEELSQEHGFDPAELRQLLTQANRVPKLIEAERKAPEKTLTWPEYRAIFMKDWRISGGVDFLREHAQTFAAVEKRYGVPPAVIAAIIGVETRYGGYTGPHRVLDSLATQGFDHPRRSKFFFNEFKEFILACRDHQLNPLEVRGSYAGAMGLPQFMPSNYRRLAVDFDGDGQTDLWDARDAIASAANYLVNFRGAGRGWQRGQAVASPIPSTPALQQLKTNTRSAPYKMAELRGRGLAGELPGVADDTAVGLVVLEAGEQTLAWLTHDNFYNLMAYNPRVFYAMAVHELATAIAAAAGDS